MFLLAKSKYAFPFTKKYCAFSASDALDIKDSAPFKIVAAS